MTVISMWFGSKRWAWRQLQGQVHMCVRTWDDCEHAVKAVGGPKKKGGGGGGLTGGVATDTTYRSIRC